MKKQIKYLILLLVFIIVSLISYFYYTFFLNTYAIKCTKNIENSKKIKFGMTDLDVIEIMGRPDTIINDGLIFYCYNLNDDSFGTGQIHFDSTMKVDKLYFPKD